MTKNALNLLFLFSIIVMISGSACISQSSQDEEPQVPIIPIVPWLEGTYQNSTYGFSVNYPSDWKLQADGTAEPVITIHNGGNSCVVQIFVERLTLPISLEQYSSDVIQEMQGKLTGFTLLSQREVILGNDIGYEQIFTGSESENPFVSRLITFVKSGNAYAVLASSEESLYELQEETINNTVYSFRLKEPAFLSDVSRDNSLVLYGIDPITLDPAVMLDSDSVIYILEIFSGLVTLDQDLKVVPDIAEKWEVSDDGLIYTFFLRNDVQFHDGKNVTADDFKYSMERACNPALGSQTVATYLGDIVGVNDKLAGRAYEISGIQVIDDYTLQVTIDEPKAYFLSKLTYSTSFVLDQENVESGDQWWRHPNGTGPFKLEEWKKSELIILERNNRYYQGVPEIHRAIFRLWGGVPMMMYENNEIDMTYVSALDIERVLDPVSSLNDELIILPELSLSYIGFNTTEPPFDDPKIRQAFCYAIDKDKIIKLLIKDLVKRADGIIPPGIPDYYGKIKGIGFDPDKATELISQSKYGNADNLPSITFTTSGLGYASPVNEALVDMWRENLGVDVGIRQIEPGLYGYTINEEKDQLFEIGWLADYPDPQNFLEILFHSEAEANSGEYNNAEVDAKLEESRKEMNSEIRMEIYAEVEQMIVNDAACLPLYFGMNYLLVKPYVQGFVPEPLPIPWLKYVSLGNDN